jgi:hypothetical protein
MEKAGRWVYRRLKCPNPIGFVAEQILFIRRSEIVGRDSCLSSHPAVAGSIAREFQAADKAATLRDPRARNASALVTSRQSERTRSRTRSLLPAVFQSHLLRWSTEICSRLCSSPYAKELMKEE